MGPLLRLPLRLCLRLPLVEQPVRLVVCVRFDLLLLDLELPEIRLQLRVHQRLPRLVGGWLDALSLRLLEVGETPRLRHEPHLLRGLLVRVCLVQRLSMQRRWLRACKAR